MNSINQPKFEVMWVDWTLESIRPADSLVEGPNWRLFFCNGEESADYLSSLAAAVIVVSISSYKEEAIIFLERVRSLWPNVTRVACLTPFSELSTESNFIAELVNRVGLHHLVVGVEQKKELQSAIQSGIEGFQRRWEENRVHQAVKLQNAKLEEMTDGLELMVAERTRYLAISKSQVEGKVNGLRGLIQFIKELPGLVDIEGMFRLIGRDIRTFHQIKGVSLAYVDAERDSKITFLQGQTVHTRPIKNSWPQGIRVRKNQVNDSQYLANEFSRPFGKTLSIPMFINPGTSESGAMLFFEHTFTDDECENFLMYIGERLQSLGTTFERIQLDDQLKSAALMWEHTFDGVQDPIAIVDLDNQVLRHNRNFGIDDSENNYCYKRFNKNIGRNCSGCPLEKALETGTPQRGQVRREDKVYLVNSYPIVLVKGVRAVTVVNHYVDITVQQELQGRMIQNEKMAAIGHLAGNIAHELNNPLTGIRSLSQILLNEVATDLETRKSDLVEVEKAATRCQSIITNLLEFSRGGNHNRQLISFNEVIERTLPFLKAAMRDYNNHVILSEEDLTINVEPQLLQQVVFNLINNACQAMGESGTLKIATSLCAPQKDSKSFCRLSISDTGEGILAEDVQRVFDPFFTTKAEGQGTGLGLSMSRGIIESMGGKIWLESIRKEGTTFYIELPLEDRSFN